MANLKDVVYENGIITMPQPNHDLDSKGIGYEYFKCMTKHKDKIFQIDVTTGEKDYFGSNLQRCVRTALKMRSLGVRAGDLITMCSYNSLNSCVPHIAAFFLGAIPTNLDPEVPFSDAVHLLKQIEPKIIFVEDHSIEQVEKLLEVTGKTSKIVAFNHSDKHTNFSEFLKPFPGEEGFEPIEVDPCKTAIIIFSSGTTGLSKGICLSHQGHLKQAFSYLQMETSYEKSLIFSRLCWTTGVCFLGLTILGGITKLVIPKFGIDSAWEAIEKFKPTYIASTPFQIATWCSRNDVFDHNTDGIKTVFIGGGVVFENQLLQYRKIFPNAVVKTGYGLTELGMTTYSVTHTKEQLELLQKKTLTIGSAIDGLSYKVVDMETKKTLGVNEIGQLMIKAEQQLNGYHNLESTEAWDSEGWFITGDIVYYDEDFYFHYVERIKEVMKYRTSHVSPKLIENLLCTHPKVKSAVVIGILHQVDCEHLMALVQLKDSYNGNGIGEELYDLVANNMEDKYKLRGGIKIVDQFPVTVSGKVDLFKIKRQYKST